MRVYIAAPFPLKHDAAALRARLSQRGTDCTSRWIDAGDGPDSKEWAEGDLADILQAHALVLLNPATYANAGTGGRHVEVGYALALEIPVIVLGQKSNIFHELCTVVKDEDALVGAIFDLSLTMRRRRS